MVPFEDTCPDLEEMECDEHDRTHYWEWRTYSDTETVDLLNNIAEDAYPYAWSFTHRPARLQRALPAAWIRADSQYPTTVGWYASPHLQDPELRRQVDNTTINRSQAFTHRNIDTVQAHDALTAAVRAIVPFAEPCGRPNRSPPPTTEGQRADRFLQTLSHHLIYKLIR